MEFKSIHVASAILGAALPTDSLEKASVHVSNDCEYTFTPGIVNTGGKTG